VITPGTSQRKFNSFIVNVVPMTNEDERALSIARPNVGMWLDKLRRAGHVIFVRQFQLGSRPNAGFRITIDGRTMTAWELWARFRSELGDAEPVSKLDTASGTYHQPR
jgi:hypothetical protein